MKPEPGHGCNARVEPRLLAVVGLDEFDLDTAVGTLRRLPLVDVLALGAQIERLRVSLAREAPR